MSARLDNISLISKGLYRIVSDVVGPECIIKLRRQNCLLWDTFWNSDSHFSETVIQSGSRAEGFKFRSSDFDLMYIDKRTTLLTESTHSTIKGTEIPTILLMETDITSPGFTFIKCLTCAPNNEIVLKSLVLKGKDAYVSSRLVRENALSSKSSTTHGPCQTDTIYGYESDHALALSCPVWPKEATTFIRRSIYTGWPPYDVLIDICKDGCLLVPINSKQQYLSDMVDIEWRISFSLAEKKLIYSTNHCQFLCYGLAKLFLNEVLKKISPVEDLLCSYFMKTAVFWEISEGPQDWSVETFLSKFRNVFRRLIQWVNEGYCPNFFIPENNMFNGKIFGENKRRLLSVLDDLYSDGYLCLLRCSSLREKWSLIIKQPYAAYTLPCNEEEYVSVSQIESERLNVIFSFNLHILDSNVKRVKTMLNNTVNLGIETEEMMCAIRLRVNYILQIYAELLLVSAKSLHPSCTCNRKQYNTTKEAPIILHKTKTFHCRNYYIYAKCSYMEGNYNKAIQISRFVKRILQSNNIHVLVAPGL